MTESKPKIGVLIFDQFEMMDAMGPVEVLGSMPGDQYEMVFVAPTHDNVKAYPHGTFLPDCSYDDCPPLEILVVPGGPGQAILMDDFDATQEFLQAQAKNARYVMGVCTGALLLAGAGLLDGHRATTHWDSLCVLDLYPRISVVGGYPRYVISGNRITSGGVTAGIDESLALIGILKGDDVAQQVQLIIQYEPKPPYNAGTPDTAPPGVIAAAASSVENTREYRVNQAERRLGMPETYPNVKLSV